MKAVVHKGEAGIAGVHYTDMPEPTVSKGQVKVRLKTAGLNHRDLFTLKRHRPDDPALILGSDGAGVVEAVGKDIDHIDVGDEVVIIPSLHWKNKSAAPPPEFEILSLPDHGTFAEAIVLPAENVAPKPLYLSWEEAGVLTLGALTAYRVLFTRAQIKAGQTVLIPGAGSGVATLLIQMAKAVGARVIVTSRSAEKRQKALELGADRAIDSEHDWRELLKDETIDLVIESVGAATWDKSLNVLKPGGTIAVFGASAGDVVSLNLRDFFYGQYTLVGSTLGSIEEAYEMLEFFNKHRIKPVIDSVYSLSDTLLAMKKIEQGSQFGKIAIKIS
ncbi:zinc-binding dehydrogenase [Tuberibacillus calidus]|jgi:zinc-binding alcohol dehydrogenase/oxidoreductase|uniref:zinc-binding dehydrogenase n=1 Tax=Tuberibacillus calidus TaxID=340097 RepID=UPI00041FF5AC|nr:zinc-binding dehydrogenase [Tuberibacillus calidus]